MKHNLQALLLASASLLLMAGPLKAVERWKSFTPPPAMPAAARSGYAPVGGIRMYYAIYGEGDPVLLIHGGLGNGDIWSRQVTDLARTRMVIVADSRGHGRSSFSNEPLSYELMASDYVALLKFLNVPKVAIVGWSDGANIGLAIAMSHPGLVRGVFANAANVNTAGLLAGGSKTSAFQAYVRKCALDYREMSKAPGDYSKLAGKLNVMWRSQPRWASADLARISVPVWVVLGDHDEVVKREHAKYISSVIPNSRLVTLKDSGHFSLVQDPAGYTEAIQSFLRAVEPEGAHVTDASLPKRLEPEPQKTEPRQEKQEAVLVPSVDYVPNLDNAEVNQQRAKAYLAASGYGGSEKKAMFFSNCGFKGQNIGDFTQALVDHARRNKVSRMEETAGGTRYEVEGKLPCVRGREAALRTVWFIDRGVSTPRLLAAVPLADSGK